MGGGGVQKSRTYLSRSAIATINFYRGTAPIVVLWLFEIKKKLKDDVVKIPLFTASFKIHLQFALLIKMILFYSSHSFDEMKNSLFSIKTKKIN